MVLTRESKKLKETSDGGFTEIITESEKEGQEFRLCYRSRDAILHIRLSHD
jgi:hypothetical protein